MNQKIVRLIPSCLLQSNRVRELQKNTRGRKDLFGFNEFFNLCESLRNTEKKGLARPITVGDAQHAIKIQALNYVLCISLTLSRISISYLTEFKKL